MIDVAVAYNRYKFLGDEFLTWLWFIIAEDQQILKKVDSEFVSLEVGNRIVLENHKKESGERITIKGDDASLEEAILALKKGAMVSELNITYTSGDLKWQFTLKGESLNISSLKTPNIGSPETNEDVEGFVLEKTYLYERMVNLLENLYAYFIKLRISDSWQNNIVPRIHKWLTST